MWVQRVLLTVGWLGWFFCGYATFLFVWTLWKHARPKHAQKWMQLVAKLGKLKDKGTAQLRNVWVTGVLMTCCAIFVLAMTRPVRYPIVQEHNVAVFGRLADGDWLMSSDEEGKFAYRPCLDFDATPILTQAIGYVALRAKWEERGACKSIRAAGLGFWWRDENNQYTLIAKEK